MTTLALETIVPQMSDSARAEIVEADVIVAVDQATQAEFTVYGTPPLESTISMKHPLAMRTVRISFDGRPGGLEKVIAMVRRIKGHDALDS